MTAPYWLIKTHCISMKNVHVLSSCRSIPFVKPINYEVIVEKCGHYDIIKVNGWRCGNVNKTDEFEFGIS